MSNGDQAGGGGEVSLSAVLQLLQLGQDFGGILAGGAQARQAKRSAKAIAGELVKIRDLTGREYGRQERRFQEQQQLEEQYAPAFEAPGEETIDIEAPGDPLAALVGKTKRQIKRNRRLRELAVSEFGTVKAAAQAVKYHESPGPTRLSVATVGLNTPVLRGSRADPAGLRRPVFLYPPDLGRSRIFNQRRT